MAEDDIAPDEPAPEPVRRRAGRPGRLVRMGCAVLALNALLLLYAGGSFLSDPAGVRCADARAAIEDDDEDVDAEDISCEQAIPRALDLEDSNIRTESAARTQGIVFVVIAVFQLAGAVLSLRTLSKRARLLALVGAGFGIVLPVLGLLTIAVMAFVVYAIFFSADARGVFGEPSGPRFMRR
jgi:hypothetical protein